MQDLAEKCKALKSVLPLLTIHLDLISRVASALGNVWESEPSVLDEPPPPRLLTPDMFCQCRCSVCPYRDECKEESWVLLERTMRRAYRRDDIVDAMVNIAARGPASRRCMAAVYWEYVDPWERWNPDTREAWALEGLQYMAESIRGPLFPFQGRQDRLAERRSRDEEIVRLRAEGLSHRKIAKAVGCSKLAVGAVLSGKRVKDGALVER